MDTMTSIVAECLVRANCILVRTDPLFTLTSGAKSPVYFDCSRLQYRPDLMRIVVAALHTEILREDLRFDFLAGGETRGIPFASWLQTTINVPAVIVHKKPKGHGAGAQISGADRDDLFGRVGLLIDDLITDGESKMPFIQGLEDAGASVREVLVVLDREQGGAALLKRSDLYLHSLVTGRQTLDAALKLGVVGRPGYITAREYLDEHSKT